MAYSTDWRAKGPVILGNQAINEVSTTQRHPLGTIVQAEDHGSNGNGTGEFMYVKGVIWLPRVLPKRSVAPLFCVGSAVAMSRPSLS